MNNKKPTQEQVSVCVNVKLFDVCCCAIGAITELFFSWSAWCSPQSTQKVLRGLWCSTSTCSDTVGQFFPPSVHTPWCFSAVTRHSSLLSQRRETPAAENLCRPQSDKHEILTFLLYILMTSWAAVSCRLEDPTARRLQQLETIRERGWI